LLALLGGPGCSGGGDTLHPVKGQVFWKGQPAKGVLLTFHLKGADPVTAIRPLGLTGEDGTFTLTTGEREGAAAGEYAVTAIWSEEAPKVKGRISTAPPDNRDRLQGAYANAATPPFKVEIKGGENALPPFQLK